MNSTNYIKLHWINNNSLTAKICCGIFLLCFTEMTLLYGKSITKQTQNQQGPILKVTSFGAVPDDNNDDQVAIQACLDKAAKTGATCFVPAGNYIINGDLWIGSNVKLNGEGSKSKLSFKKGTLRILKNNSTAFNYTNNYNNEVVPNEQKTVLVAVAQAGDTKIRVKDGSIVKAGDLAYLYNNIKNSWTVLEDSKSSAIWNDPQTPMARKDIFIIKNVSGNTLTLDRALNFSYGVESIVGPHVGATNITVSNLSIENFVSLYSILFEQPRSVTISNVTINGGGGILLSHMAYKCSIIGCNITTTKTRAILVENFSSGNTISNNTVNYTTGGDAAVMVLMSSYNNSISGNKVIGHGNNSTDEAGIYVHALCFNNSVFNNEVNGTSDGIGVYYGAFNNKFYKNTIRNVKVGIMSFYSRDNEFYNNDIYVQSKRAGNPVGVLIFQGSGININNNIIKGRMAMGVQLQGSDGCKILSNTIEGISADQYSFGIKVLNNSNGNATKANVSRVAGSGAATSKALSSQTRGASTNQIENNKISKVQTNIANQ